MTAKTETPLVPRFDSNGRTSYAAAAELREENARLKGLVAQLSAIIAKNVVAQK